MANIVNKGVEFATLGLVKDVTGSEAAGRATGRAADLQAQAQQQRIGEARRQFEVTQASFAPFQEAGVGALQEQQALLGLSGREAEEAAFASFRDSPGQQFLKDRAQRNTVRNASAIGGLGGGNVRSALVQQGVGFAQQDFQNRFGRLEQIAGQGLAATSNVGQFGQQTSQQIQRGITGGAEARASGILGKTQARSQATGQILQLLGQGAGAAAGAGGFS